MGVFVWFVWVFLGWDKGCAIGVEVVEVVYNSGMLYLNEKNMSLSPTVGSIVRNHGVGLIAGVKLLVDVGFDRVQLDVRLSGVGAGDLGVRGRKDLIKQVLRAGARVTGLDYFVEPDVYLDIEKVDRAVHELIETIGLAGDLGRLPLSLNLPYGELGGDVVGAIAEAADGYGVMVLTHGEGDVEGHKKWLEGVGCGYLKAGIEPAVAMHFGEKADEMAHGYGELLGGGRLSDAQVLAGGKGGAVRCVVGEGGLDLAGYRIGLEVNGGYVGPCVLSLNGLGDPLRGAVRAKQVWEGVGGLGGM